ncbi:diguanylate cyclase with PAS/PAC sensor [Sphingobium chlorophenolicum L-1]|uniref:diguanylate cyclase n=1 Tax=Sphingobium chlorophenolicum L-1 TaxID=690566 RepID=F6ETT6_SPHCR|nr:sensor domain-containing diguanylate cyclase [Sphingobium chlorophenolicum]AEG50511.1 diguanylate cyclase with PAS/PAC sensor [Sphingobium chlorophenolicum L-1]
MQTSLRHPSSPLAPFALGCVYFLMASAALVSSRFEGGLAFIWGANALLMAYLLTSRTSDWPGVLIACAVASALSTALWGMGLSAAVPMACVNLLEALIVALICRRFAPGGKFAGSMQPLFVFVLALCGPANLIAGAAAASVASTVTDVPFGASLLQWYTGHVLGGLTCTPILMMLMQGELRRWFGQTSRRAKWEAMCLLLMFALATAYVFYIAHFPMLFALLLPMVAIVFRIGNLGAAASVMILAIVGGMATLTGHGPLHMIPGTLGERMQYFQLFLAFSFLLSMPIAAELNSRRRLFQMLQESEARYRAIAENSGDVVLNISVAGIIEYASPAVAEQIGCAPELLVGQDAADLVDPKDRDQMVAALHRALAQPGDVQTVEFRPFISDEGREWCEMLVRAVVDERGMPTGLVSTIRDMSRHKARQRALQQAAALDSLTGADTRRAFLEKLEEEMSRVRRGGRASLLLIDIDHFKAVNDCHGHGAGDRVLAGFVERLRPGLRGVDSIGRLGGEEFAILLSGTDVERASMICERLREMVSAHPVRIDSGEMIRVTFSAGLVSLGSQSDGQAVLDAADKALYNAKHSGRNCLRLAA